jgi:hypothetical protein
MILVGTFLLSADPGKVFFIISILKQSSADCNFPVLIRFEQRPPAIEVFAAEGP